MLVLKRAVLRESISLFAVESAVESEDSALLEVVERPVTLLFVVESALESEVSPATRLLFVVESALESEVSPATRLLFVVESAPLVAVDKAEIWEVNPGLMLVLSEVSAAEVEVESVALAAAFEALPAEAAALTAAISREF
jgi:hypothetical protein